MIETQLSPRVIEAQARAHKERADAFARLLEKVPHFIASLRKRG